MNRREFLKKSKVIYFDRFKYFLNSLHFYDVEQILKEFDLNTNDELRKRMEIKRTDVSKIEKASQLADDIKKFMENESIFNKSFLKKMLNRFQCLPKSFKNEFHEIFDIPLNIGSKMISIIYPKNKKMDKRIRRRRRRR